MDQKILAWYFKANKKNPANMGFLGPMPIMMSGSKNILISDISADIPYILF